MKQRRPEPVAEPGHSPEHQRDAVVDVLQPLHMGDETRDLPREEESLRRAFAPCLHGVLGGQAIEGAVDLGRVETLRIEGQEILVAPTSGG